MLQSQCKERGFTPAREAAHGFSQPVWLSQPHSLILGLFQPCCRSRVDLPLCRTSSRFQGLRIISVAVCRGTTPQCWDWRTHPCSSASFLTFLLSSTSMGNKEKDEDSLKKKKRKLSFFYGETLQGNPRPHQIYGQPQNQAGRCQSQTLRGRKRPSITAVI